MADRQRKDCSLLIKGLARLKHYPNDRGRVQNIIKENLRAKELYEVLSLCDNMTAIWIVEDLEDQKILKKVFLEKGKKQEHIWRGGTIHRRSWTSTDEEISILAAERIKDRNELLKIREGTDNDLLKTCACGRLGHNYETIRDWDEHARFGSGYRSHTLYQCRICGYEKEKVYEHDN